MLLLTLYALLGLLMILSFAAHYRLIRVFRHSKAPRYATKMAAETDLPSVTVCIPARNEAHALSDCLDKVIHSTYDKLEIIVLDDVSGDDTSALIRSYASEGVRFLKGAELPAGWLGKNHALQGLLTNASGSYVFFMDVDTRLEPEAIEHTVRFAIRHRLAMVSVLPRREDGWRMSILFSPLRYFWELLFSRADSPATASNAWLIRRETLLRDFQGFETLKSAIQPEGKIAAALSKVHAYGFITSTESFGVGYEKKWRSQLITSVRLLFPLLNNQWLLVFAALAHLVLFLVPYGIGVVALFNDALIPLPLVIVAALVILSFTSLYGQYTFRMWRRGSWVGALLWPVLVVQEIVLVIASTFQYQRSTVKWKGRFIQREVQN